MRPDEYLANRQRLGLTQSELAVRLGVARSTVERREKGKMAITPEAALAILALRSPGRARRRPNVRVSYGLEAKPEDH
jgi:transcriptional regulator with XRE-family HTH domain